jgi:imidazole glycerol-phosphate synthase subunit HisH
MTSEKKVAIVDYGIGNTYSIISAFKYIGIKAELISDIEKIANSKILVLPGVGSFKSGMEALKSNNMDQAIIDAVNNKDAKILGICLGMQLLCSYGEEDGGTQGLGLLSNHVKRFTVQEVGSRKIPHVGFNALHINKKEGLFKGLSGFPDFYFTHSYYVSTDDNYDNYATCKYGINFLAAYQSGNIFGVQFHPEKSQTNGLIMLKNFILSF